MNRKVFLPLFLASAVLLSLAINASAVSWDNGSKTVYFDDIRLHPSRCLYKPWEDLNDDCVVDFKDFTIMANNWMKSSRI